MQNERWLAHRASRLAEPLLCHVDLSHAQILSTPLHRRQILSRLIRSLLSG